MGKIDFNLFMDLHNHTVWSDGADKPEDIIGNAIEHNLNMVGITDHFCHANNRSLGFEKIKHYISKISKLREKYCDKIEVLIGLEISYSYLLKNHEILPYDTLNKLDYILLENLDYIPSTTRLENVGVLLNKFDCQKGLAHTDLMRLSERLQTQGGLDYVLDFVKSNELFWEINIESDHPIFFDLLQQQSNDKKTKVFIDAVKARRIPVSVGSDTHSLVHYDFGRLKRANDIARMLNLSGEEVKS